MIKILIGGSPCTYWSVAQKKGREVEAEGLGWELFRNYLIAKEKFKPDFFLYENNKSAAQPIVVLSMYDGIGTGRYCLDKMGFTNVTYYAYEIDKPAMTVALSNYPDIIQLGDAFDLRRDDWELGKRFEHTTEQEAEMPESTNQTTDLSDAPKEIKEQIIENDRALKERDAPAPATLPEGFDVVDQLAELLAERKKLHIIDEENLRYNCDIIALEYAIGALRR